MTKREAGHAGSWYTSDGQQLAKQLDQWLDQVNPDIDGVGNIPQDGARVIIAPHAGYAYSGPAAAWAYKSLDLSKVKRVFLLGPSHHLYLLSCALSPHTHYTTPLGDLTLDLATIADLRSTGQFQDLTAPQDYAEHSLEMHLPYIYRVLSKTFPDSSSFPPLVPIMIGATTAAQEEHYGALLAPYLADPTSIFVISSDFCHWGSRFSYTYYLPSDAPDVAKGISLRKSAAPTSPPIHESIGCIDQAAMDAISTGDHKKFLDNLRQTKNTVCGRHPIGVIMAAIEEVRKIKARDGGGGNGWEEQGKGKFQFVRYERSSEVKDARDSSVSYASAFAVL